MTRHPLPPGTPSSEGQAVPDWLQSTLWDPLFTETHCSHKFSWPLGLPHTLLQLTGRDLDVGKQV